MDNLRNTENGGLVMQNNKKIGDEALAKNEVSMLKKELEIQMRSINDERDVEKIKKIMERLEKLEPTVLTISYEERLQNFRNNILPKAERDREEFNLIKKTRNERKNSNIFLQRFVKIGFSSIFILIFVNFATITFAGLSIFQPFISWTDETFNKSNRDNNLIEANQNYNIIEKDYGLPILKPNYLIEYYELVLFDKVETDTETNFFIRYNNNDKNSISYDITIYKTGKYPDEYRIEKTSDEVELYTKDDITYYIIKNINWYCVTWDYFNVGYTAAGFETKEVVKEFLEKLEYKSIKQE